MIMNNTIKIGCTAVVFTLLTACSANSEKGNPSDALENLPKWVVSPTSETGLADSACVEYSGSLNIDRSQAIVLASEQLAAQLQRKVSFLAKSFQSKTKTTEGLNVGANFTQTGQQLVQQTLVGSKAIETGVYEVSGKEQLCVLVELNEDKTKAFYANMKKASKANLSAQDDGVLYEQFRAYKADQELQKAIQE